MVYKLSSKADSDLEEILLYSRKEFGEDKAVSYVSDMHSLFSKLTIYPEIGRKRDEIKRNLRSIPIGKHVAFYRIFKDKIRIVRVLHSKSDIPRFFK